MIRTACTKNSSSVYLYGLQDNLGSIMRVINFSDARNQFKQVIDQVVADCDVTIISRREAEDAVVMSLDTYNSMMETLHLLKSPANVKHLEKSLAQYHPKRQQRQLQIQREQHLCKHAGGWRDMV